MISSNLYKLSRYSSRFLNSEREITSSTRCLHFILWSQRHNCQWSLILLCQKKGYQDPWDLLSSSEATKQQWDNYSQLDHRYGFHYWYHRNRFQCTRCSENTLYLYLRSPWVFMRVDYNSFIVTKWGVTVHTWAVCILTQYLI